MPQRAHLVCLLRHPRVAVSRSQTLSSSGLPRNRGIGGNGPVQSSQGCSRMVPVQSSTGPRMASAHPTWNHILGQRPSCHPAASGRGRENPGPMKQTKSLRALSCQQDRQDAQGQLTSRSCPSQRLGPRLLRPRCNHPCRGPRGTSKWQCPKVQVHSWQVRSLRCRKATPGHLWQSSCCRSHRPRDPPSPWDRRPCPASL
mmetsp:Transcript_88868/g.176739  ORF Transcript_88868/g.176739 Transcript_88868/m.176739 type:complete len:200 (-) Transcript_88868:549-1148(-)